jgi:hypothetical protein
MYVSSWKFLASLAQQRRQQRCCSLLVAHWSERQHVREGIGRNSTQLCREVRRQLNADARSIDAAQTLLQGNVLRLSLSSSGGYADGGSAGLGAGRAETLRVRAQLREAIARSQHIEAQRAALVDELVALRASQGALGGAVLAGVMGGKLSDGGEQPKLCASCAADIGLSTNANAGAPG